LPSEVASEDRFEASDGRRVFERRRKALDLALIGDALFRGVATRREFDPEDLGLGPGSGLG
jgi:hypothetical protein